MIPRLGDEESASHISALETTIVTNKTEVPIYDAVQVQNEDAMQLWRRRHQTHIFGGIILIAALSVAVAVEISMNSTKEREGNVSVGVALLPSLHPSFHPTKSSVPSPIPSFVTLWNLSEKRVGAQLMY